MVAQYGIRAAFNRAFDRFRDGTFKRAVLAAIQFRYATVAAAIAALIVSAGLVAGGRVAFNFFLLSRPMLYLLMLGSSPAEGETQQRMLFVK